MKAPKITFVCRECGATSLRWLGKCPDCGSWDSFDEIEVKPQKQGAAPRAVSHAEKFSELELPNYMRSKTGISELDRVLGGGLVDSSVVLISGAMPAFRASASSTIDFSPMPYIRISAWLSSRMDRFMLSDQ